jgi:hypothetical protein
LYREISGLSAGGSAGVFGWTRGGPNFGTSDSGMRPSSVSKAFGERWAYRWVTSTVLWPRIFASFSKLPPLRTHSDANVCRVAWYQVRDGPCRTSAERSGGGRSTAMVDDPSIKKRIVRIAAVVRSDAVHWGTVSEVAALAQTVLHDTVGSQHPLSKSVEAGLSRGDFSRVVGVLQGAGGFDDRDGLSALVLCEQLHGERRSDANWPSQGVAQVDAAGAGAARVKTRRPLTLTFSAVYREGRPPPLNSQVPSPGSDKMDSDVAPSAGSRRSV